MIHTDIPIYIIAGLISVSVFITGFSILLLFRNQEVYNERTRVVELISKFAKKEVELGHNWIYLYKEYDLVSYNRMVLLFWIPVKNFYKPMIKKYNLEQIN